MFKKVLIIGMARSGISSAKILKSLGVDVFISDRKTNLDDSERETLEKLNIPYELGKHTLENFKNFDVIVTSPGVPIDSPSLKYAFENNIKVISEIELAHLLTKTPILAITGSNGKTTTTSLIYDIMRLEFDNVACGGNIGYPLIELSLENHKYLIAEISSFQLETIETFKPKVALLLNIYENHLDRHKTMDVYIDTKKRIFMNQDTNDFAILNADDENLNFDGLKSNIIPFSTKKKLDNGVFVENGKIVSNINNKYLEIIDIKDIPLLGQHNIENCVAATAVCLSVNVKPENIRMGIKNFKAITHRLETVEIINDVRFINDSKSTNYTSSIKAIESFENNLILILGGRDKGGNFEPLAQKIKEKVKTVILQGEAKEHFKDELLKNNYENIYLENDLNLAVIKAFNIAKKGDTVLFSPACTSFDMFSNYEERGEFFKKYVQSLLSI